MGGGRGKLEEELEGVKKGGEGGKGQYLDGIYEVETLSEDSVSYCFKNSTLNNELFVTTISHRDATLPILITLSEYFIAARKRAFWPEDILPL